MTKCLICGMGVTLYWTLPGTSLPYHWTATLPLCYHKQELIKIFWFIAALLNILYFLLQKHLLKKRRITALIWYCYFSLLNQQLYIVQHMLCQIWLVTKKLPSKLFLQCMFCPILHVTSHCANKCQQFVQLFHYLKLFSSCALAQCTFSIMRRRLSVLNLI